MLPIYFGTPLFFVHLQPKAAVFLWHLGGFAVVRAARGTRGVLQSVKIENRTSAHVRSKNKTGRDIGLPPRPPRRLWVRLFAVLGEVGR